MANLNFLAGTKALERIRRGGLRPDAVRVVAGAAGAAKWLVLSQLDRIIFGQFFRGRREPLILLGSSIGAWRFAAASQTDPVSGISRFEEAYIQQCYERKPSASQVSSKSYSILNEFLPINGPSEVMTHPFHRLSLLAVRSRWPTASDRKLPLCFGLAGAGAGNVLSAGFLRLFFERTLFYDPRTPPPFLQAEAFASQSVSLSPQNLRQALMASGSIPLVMSGVKDIAGTSPGVYRDGGIMDYHLNVPFLPTDEEKIVLFPHFDERLVPGWFDKHLPWRRPNPDRMSQVLLLAPSREFIARLPFGKIPDRNDFLRFQGRDEERFRYWRQVVRECQRLADEFHEVIEKGLIAERVQPLFNHR